MIVNLNVLLMSSVPCACDACCCLRFLWDVDGVRGGLSHAHHAMFDARHGNAHVSVRLNNEFSFC